MSQGGLEDFINYLFVLKDEETSHSHDTHIVTEMLASLSQFAANENTSPDFINLMALALFSVALAGGAYHMVNKKKRVESDIYPAANLEERLI